MACLATVTHIFAASLRSYDAVSTEESTDVFLHLKSGQLLVVSSDLVNLDQNADVLLQIVTEDESELVITWADVDSVGTTPPSDFPTFTSFKFNNKYNDQVFVDVEATVLPDTVRAIVGAIGKWLTPSFKLSDDQAQAWVGTQRQYSKQSRLPFDGDVTYVLGYDHWKRLKHRKVSDEVWSDPESGAVTEDILLTAEQFTTNAPSNYDEGLDKMLDGNPNTFFHSTWGSGEYEKLPSDSCPYIEVTLEEAIQHFTWGYTTRYDQERIPTEFLLQASYDGESWVDIKTYTAGDGVPQSGLGQMYESPTVHLDAPCQYLRLTMLAATYKNYLCLSEFWMAKVISETSSEPELIAPAQYAYSLMPYGREVCAQVTWLTDTAEVPKVYINTDLGILPFDKETYLKSYIRIDGAGVFPDFEDSVNIRGRGNTSWAGQSGKSPYRLKFESSKKPFGLTKGKSWVLLANKQTGSMLSNATAMKIASMVQTAGANRIIPIELYINDEYRGSYNFTQQVGLSNNSIDLDDESNAVLLELDSYYDEDYRFRTDSYYLPVNVKDPDLLEDYADPDAQFQVIQDDFNRFCETLYSGGENYANLVDVGMLAKFLLVNELVMNLELGHPKSTFLYKEDLTALHSRYIFGPVWDFDWAFGYEKTYNYCTSDPTYDYFSGLVNGSGYGFFNNLRYNSEAVRRAYYQEWTNFMDKHYAELLDYVETYYLYANPSFVNNSYKWIDGYDYETVKNNTVNWLRQRAQYIYDNLEAYDLDEPLAISSGDANLDGYITVADVVSILNNLLNLPNETFEFAQADLDNSGEITINDVVHAIALVLNQPETATSVLTRPLADATLKMSTFNAQLGEASHCPMTLKVESNDFVAMQFELTLPQDVSLEDVTLGEAFKNHQVVFNKVNDGVYRVALFSENGATIPAGTHQLEMALQTNQMLHEANRVISSSAVLLTTKVGEDKRMASQSAKFNIMTTGIHDVQQATAILGGDVLTVETLVARTLYIYTLDGRCVKQLNIQPGKHTINLPEGIYIVDGQKVIVASKV